MKFSFTKLNRELYLIEKHYTNKKSGAGNDISGPYWMLIQVTVLKGQLTWLADGKMKTPEGSKFYLYVPPYSWTMEQYTAGSEVCIRGLISKEPLKAENFKFPTLISSSKPFPKTANDAELLLSNCKILASVALCSNPSALSQRTKNLLDTGYQTGFEIQQIAKKLKTSSAVVSRTFKKDYGHPPAYYRRGLRVTVAMFELMIGKAPAEAALLAGYGDLSRFYKQFKEYMLQTPAEYLDKSKNAKKSR